MMAGVVKQVMVWPQEGEKEFTASAVSSVGPPCPLSAEGPAEVPLNPGQPEHCGPCSRILGAAVCLKASVPVTHLLQRGAVPTSSDWPTDRTDQK